MSDIQAAETLHATSEEPTQGEVAGTSLVSVKNPTNYIRFNASGVAYGVGFTPDATLPADALPCTAEQRANWQSWANVNGVLTATTPPVPTLPQQAAALLQAGLTITFTGSLTLTATFAATAQAMHIWEKLSTVLSETGAFPGGATTWDMPDTAGGWPTFTIAQWKVAASAIAAFNAQALLVLAGHPNTTLPASTITLGV